MAAFAEHGEPQRPGRVLAAERERQGLAPSDIAQRLHMSVSQVEALEVDDYTRLPRGPFLRGFIRNYAKVVGLPPNDVVALLAEGSAREPAPRIVVPSQNIRFDPLADRIASPYVRAAAIATVAVALGFAAMYWWLFVRNAPPMNAARKPAETVAVAPAAVPPAPAPMKAAPPAATFDAPRPSAEPSRQAVEPAKVEPAKSDAKPMPLKPEAARPEAPPKPPVAVQRVAATEAGGTLKFRFSGKSWVEVRDAGGQVLLTGLNDAGSESEVSGRPPFKVVVGNAPDVRMRYNDREFDLAPHMREAVARVIVE